jgi:hypothetical protein
MASSFSLTPGIRVFPCPNCGETINTTVQQCPFCSTIIDHNAAEASAAATAHVSQAISDASYLKVMAWAILSFFLVMFIPFLGLVGFAGLWFLRIAIPFMLIRWWVRYGKIKTDDREFSQARGTTYIVAAVWFLALGTAFFYR